MQRWSLMQRWTQLAVLLLAVGLSSCGSSQPAEAASPARTTGVADCVMPPGDLEVHFQAPDGMWLEGTASFPERDASRRLPAVVFAHPAGAQSRDGVVSGQWGLNFGFEIRVLEELARDLTKRGFVVLRFDKRSCSRVDSCAGNDYPAIEEPVYVYDLLRDLSAAVSAASGLPGVAPNDVHLFGYGESAPFALSILRRDRRVRSAAVFALDMQPIGAAAVKRARRLERIGTATGLSQEEVASMASRSREFGWDLTELALFGVGGAGRIANRRDGFWIDAIQQHLSILSPRQWTRDKPVLLLFGDADWTLGASHVAAWNESITRAKANAVAVSLPCITHALNCLSGEGAGPIAGEHIGRHVDPTVLDVLAQHFRASSASALEPAHPRTEKACSDRMPHAPLRLAHEGPLERSSLSGASCLKHRGCSAGPIPLCEPGLQPRAMKDWQQEGQRITTAARLGVQRGSVTDMACDGDECCNSSTGALDLRETLSAPGISFEFAGKRVNACQGDDSGVCCPVPAHTKDGGGLVIATGTLHHGRILDAELCRPRPEDYGEIIDFDRGSPPLRDVTRGISVSMALLSPPICPSGIK